METPMSKAVHQYATRVIWEGNLGGGTSGYGSYSRKYRMVIAGKPDLVGTADPAFRGEQDKHNPEELFLMSISACHMLFYLSLCARKGVQVVAYEDNATGTMRVEGNGGGRFEEITLHPKVTLACDQEGAVAADLHAEAHALCFIANSCAAPIRHVAKVVVQQGEER
jgi:organic hydroperoxide reductase OsmC/OhrA